MLEIDGMVYISSLLCSSTAYKLFSCFSVQYQVLVKPEGPRYQMTDKFWSNYQINQQEPIQGYEQGATGMWCGNTISGLDFFKSKSYSNDYVLSSDSIKGRETKLLNLCSPMIVRKKHRRTWKV